MLDPAAEGDLLSWLERMAGSGIMTTAVFRLMGSEYAVTWEARDTGSTYIEASSGCDWSVTFTAQ